MFVRRMSEDILNARGTDKLAVDKNFGNNFEIRIYIECILPKNAASTIMKLLAQILDENQNKKVNWRSK